MSENILNMNHIQLLNKVDSYEKYLESLNSIKYSWMIEIIELAEKYKINENIIPRDIKRFRNLEKLNLSEYDIGDCTYELYNLGYLHKLREVSFYSSTQDKLPLFLARSDSIKKVSLNFPSIPKLDFYDFSYLDRVEELEIFGKNIILPQNSIHAKNIKKLKLQGNIKELPKSIEHCTSLKRLDLSFNSLEEIPDEICLLKNLEYLNLSHNKLKKLPKCINLLNNNIYINCESNNFSSLKKIFYEFKFKNKINFGNDSG